MQEEGEGGQNGRKSGRYGIGEEKGRNRGKEGER